MAHIESRSVELLLPPLFGSFSTSYYHLHISVSLAGRPLLLADLPTWRPAVRRQGCSADGANV